MSVTDAATTMQVMAGKDLTALRGMLDSAQFADEIFGFHAQQSIEKLLKAWITLAGGTFGFIHDLELLLSHLKRLGVDSDRFSPLIEFAAYAVQFRYTEIDLEDAPLDRPETIRKITELFEHVQMLMASQVTPQTNNT
jgi:HEPN domain-containing protein